MNRAYKMTTNTNINLFSNTASPKNPTLINLTEWFNLIKESDYKPIIETARSFGKEPSGSPERVYTKTKKYKLPCVTYNFRFEEYMCRDNIISSTGLMYIDIDRADFNANQLDKSKVLALYKSFGGLGWSLIVRVEGLTPDNFKASYFSICNDLGIEDYIDMGAVKPTQYNVLSFDPDIYVNTDPFVFKSLVDIPAPHTQHKEKAYTGLGGQEIRFDNLDEIPVQKDNTHAVNWEGWKWIRCYPLYTKQSEGRYRFVLSFLTNLKYLNPDLSEEEAFYYAKLTCQLSFYISPNDEVIKKAIQAVFIYFSKGKLMPKYYKKTRKIVFNQSMIMSRKEKQEIVINELKKRWKTISEKKIYDILESWNFRTLGKISQRKIYNNFPVSKKTVEKYWPEFKEYVITLNEN